MPNPGYLFQLREWIVSAIQVYPDFSPSAQFTDGACNNSTAYNSVGAAFVASDAGAGINGGGIPSNTLIESVTSGTSVVLSNATTGGNLTGQTFTITNRPKSGFKPFTTFNYGNPANGVTIGQGGIPASVITGYIKGNLSSALQNQIAQVGIRIRVYLSEFPEMRAQSIQATFGPVQISIGVSEDPQVNSGPEGTGWDALSVCESINACLKMLAVPNSIANASGKIMPAKGRANREVAPSHEGQLGLDIYELPFEIVSIATDQRTAP